MENIYYHIQRKGDWEVGKKIFVGREKNHFCGHFDKFGTFYKSSLDGKFYDAHFIGNLMINFLNSKQKDRASESFYDFNANETVKFQHETIIHYLKATRELLFEEIRKDFFPQLPSRQRGIWIIPANKDAVNYWWKKLGATGTIFQVEITGKIHQANEQYLNLSTNSFDLIRENAFKYWASPIGNNSIQDECIFEGFVEVKAIKQIEDFK